MIQSFEEKKDEDDDIPKTTRFLESREYDLNLEKLIGSTRLLTNEVDKFK